MDVRTTEGNVPTRAGCPHPYALVKTSIQPRGFFPGLGIAVQLYFVPQSWGEVEDLLPSLPMRNSLQFLV